MRQIALGLKFGQGKGFGRSRGELCLFTLTRHLVMGTNSPTLPRSRNPRCLALLPFLGEASAKVKLMPLITEFLNALAWALSPPTTERL